MKIAGMLQDTLRSLVHAPATELTPVAAPPRLRGRLHWNSVGCTGCTLCVKDCPANAIELIRLDDKDKVKRFVMRYSADRCTFCGQCVENCRFDCISMPGEEYSLAASTPAGFTIYYGDDADVRQVLAEQPADGDRAVEKLA